jgi:hypothetical protein
MAKCNFKIFPGVRPPDPLTRGWDPETNVRSPLKKILDKAPVSKNNFHSGARRLSEAQLLSGILS